jgi:hypothetical protein
MNAPFRIARRFFSLCCALAILGVGSFGLAAPPSEEDQARGRAFAIDGAKAYRTKNFQQALDNFKKAQTLYPSGQVWRMTGYSLMALERWVAAADALDRALKVDFKPLLPADAEHAEDNLAEVLKHVATVDMRSAAASATVSIDDGEERALPLEVRLAEGMHRFVVRAAGHDPIDKSISLAGGKTHTLDLDPNKRVEAEAKTPPGPGTDEESATELEEPEEPGEPFDLFAGLFPHQRTIGLAVGGVGVVLGAAAIASAAGGSALRSSVSENIAAHETNYDAQCSQHTSSCLNDIGLINRDGERAQDMQKTGAILGIAAAASIAIGGTFFLLAPDGPLAGPKTEGRDAAGLACAPWLDAVAALGSANRANTSLGGVGLGRAGLSCVGRF